MCKFYRIASNGLQTIQIVHELFDCPSYISRNKHVKWAIYLFIYLFVCLFILFYFILFCLFYLFI